MNEKLFSITLGIKKSMVFTQKLFDCLLLELEGFFAIQDEKIYNQVVMAKQIWQKLTVVDSDGFKVMQLHVVFMIFLYYDRCDGNTP